MNLRNLVRKLCVAFAGWCTLLSGQQPELRDQTKARWVTLDTAQLASRFLFARSGDDRTIASQVQHQEVISGRFHLDRKQRFSIGATAGAGKHFTAGWAHTPIGQGAGDHGFFLKRLYLSLQPLRGIELQYGGLDVERGASTPIASYHPMAFITGQRLVLSRPELGLDKIAVTFGYLGDLDNPGMEKHFHRLKRTNYNQVLVGKKVGERADLSFDYTNQWGAKTLRQGVAVRTPWSITDTVRFDLYERVNRRSSAGAHIGASRSFWKLVGVDAGFAAIDRYYGDLNDDAFFHGRRLYAGGNVRLVKGFTLSALFNQAVGNDYAVGKKRHFEIGLGFSALAFLPNAGKF